MYRAIALTPSDRDLHRFVWRSSPGVPLQDFHMTHVLFHSEHVRQTKH